MGNQCRRPARDCTGRHRMPASPFHHFVRCELVALNLERSTAPRRPRLARRSWPISGLSELREVVPRRRYLGVGPALHPVMPLEPVPSRCRHMPFSETIPKGHCDCGHGGYLHLADSYGRQGGSNFLQRLRIVEGGRRCGWLTDREPADHSAQNLT